VQQVAGCARRYRRAKTNDEIALRKFPRCGFSVR
jgi:hypothetical protein